jgi:1-phosphofructokinase family hexose kinase
VIVCVAANPSIDKLFEVDRVEIGAIHRPRSFTQVPGGKGLNCARAAHALGAAVMATGILAGHAGRWIEEALAADGVPNRFAWSSGETRASLSVADDSGRGMTEFYERGSEIGSETWGALEDVVGDLASGASWLTISGFLPLGAPDDGYARLAAIAIERGARVALDARDDALAHGLRAGPHIVKVNAEETATLLGQDVATEEEAVAAAGKMRARVDRPDVIVIVTRGADGAIVWDPNGDTFRARLDERGPYPVGSGDAFLGGLVAAFERGSSLSDAIALALGAAAANAELPGAGRLDAARAVRLAGGAVVERITAPAPP